MKYRRKISRHLVGLGFFFIFALVIHTSNLCIIMNALMRKIGVFHAIALSGLLMLCGCGKEVMEENTAESNSRLTILTRGVGDTDDVAVALPVRAYVFEGGGKCVAVQTLEDESEPFSLELPEGTYSLYAIGGADESRLVLPSQADASETSTIRQQEGKTLDDLMLAHSVVTLSAHGTNTLTLGMERKVIQVKSIVIRNVPEDATDVSIRIAPVYRQLLLNGTYQGEDGSGTVSLKKQADGTTWKDNGTGAFLLPSVGKPTITVSIGNSNYSYTSTDVLDANYKISIEGTYTENSGAANMTLSGTITGAVWAGEKTIRFSFDEKGSKTAEDESQESGGSSVPAAPAGGVAAGTLYKGCYVLEADGNRITVLSAKEGNRIVDGADTPEAKWQKVAASLSAWSVEGISATWRLPTEEEIELIYKAWTAINASGTARLQVGSGATYMYEGDSAVHIFSIGKNGYSMTGIPAAGSLLRPVATVMVE